MSDSERKDLVTRALEDPRVRHEVEREWFIDETIVQIERKMEELGITRKELATRLECSPPNVTQILRHGSNLTLGTLMDVALAIGHRFLSPVLVPVSASAPWESSSALVLTTATRAWPPMEEEGTTSSSTAYLFQAGEEGVVLHPYSEQHSGETYAS